MLTTNVTCAAALTALLLVALAGCSSSGTPAPFHGMPDTARSESVVVPAELRAEFAALADGSYTNFWPPDTWPTIPLAYRRARPYYLFSRLAENGQTNFLRNSVQIATLPLLETDAESMAADLDSRFGLTHTLLQFESGPARCFLSFQFNRDLQLGELAWLADQIVSAYPDAFVTAEPAMLAGPGGPG
jgi:hypothetical protein